MKSIRTILMFGLFMSHAAQALSLQDSSVSKATVIGKTNTVPKASSSFAYKAVKGPVKIIVTVAALAYIHQNIMTQENITKLPELSSKDMINYKNKSIRTIKNSYESIQQLRTLCTFENARAYAGEKAQMARTYWDAFTSTDESESTDMPTIVDKPQIKIESPITAECADLDPTLSSVLQASSDEDNITTDDQSDSALPELTAMNNDTENIDFSNHSSK